MNGQECFEFENFRLDPSHLLLFRGSEQIDLAPRVIETLVALVNNNGRILNKDELMQLVWPDTVVDESNIFQNLYLLRKTLGIKRDGDPFIETLRRRGYRFSADVTFRELPAHSLLKESVLPSPLAPTHSSKTPMLRADRQFSNGGLVLCIALLLCVLVTVIASLFYRPWSGFSLDANSPRQFPASIAVIPFRMINIDLQRLSQGICDALITRLGNEHKVIVRPTRAVRQYIDPDQDTVEIGRMQGVEAVLDGSIQQDAGRIRVTVQLIDTLSGVTIWSAQFDASNANALDVQDSISERVITEMYRDLASDEPES